ncbi:hypothetical protein AB0M36_06185 [Actinoplanes sp. NPDC051346]|uniref:hypothetical protein n=1 Tax=Actinoplanes sp. NPDC051346 TaxID=3155048 RepID=UPI0034394F35
MPERPDAVRQLPCPDCGSPVHPDREQLCPGCGYPLMFLRQPAEDDARAIPRAPGERNDATGVMSVPEQRSARVPPSPAVGYGQARCPQCGYGNDPVRIRCERCGFELRQARPQAVSLGPPAPQEAPRRWGWLIVLIVLAVLSLLILMFVLLRETVT